jgi:hypothetical protein
MRRRYTADDQKRMHSPSALLAHLEEWETILQVNSLHFNINNSSWRFYFFCVQNLIVFMVNELKKYDVTSSAFVARLNEVTNACVVAETQVLCTHT